MPLSRITVTVPRELVHQADRRAKELDRSRSWVVAEALRGYLGAAAPGDRSRAVREPSGPASEAGLGPSRAAQLEADLTPTPEERVRAAEEVAAARRRHLAAEVALPIGERLRRAEALGQLARRAQGLGRRCQIIGFDSYEDYYEWRRGRLIGR